MFLFLKVDLHILIGIIDMSIKGIVYLSDARVRFDMNSLYELSVVSAGRNNLVDVTGYLCFSQNRFIQYIEGASDVVARLMALIRQDPRHSVIYEIENTFSERKFPAWGMRYITREELERFNIEVYIENNIILLKNNVLFKEKCTQMLWDKVDRIASIHSNLYQ